MSKRLVLYNVSDNLTQELGVKNDIISLENIDNSIDVVFIDWIPTRKKPNKEMIEQLQLTEFCIKNKIKLVIFDRYRELTRKEFKFLKKHNTVFLEPAIINRTGFIYHPLWLSIPNNTNEMSYKPFTYDREFDIGFVGDVTGRIKEIDKFYPTLKGYGDYNVTVSSSHALTKLSGMKKLEYERLGIDTELGRFGQGSNIRFTVLIDKQVSYETGFMTSSFIDIIEGGTVPLLPSDHRMYHAIFKGFIVDNEKDVASWLNVNKSAAFGCVYQIYESILKHFPEMDIRNNAIALDKYL